MIILPSDGTNSRNGLESGEGTVPWSVTDVVLMSLRRINKRLDPLVVLALGNRRILSVVLFLVGGLEHQFYFPIDIGLLIIPIDELIFFRGVAEPPTSNPCYTHFWYHRKATRMVWCFHDGHPENLSCLFFGLQIRCRWPLAPRTSFGWVRVSQA